MEENKFKTGQVILIDKPLTWTSFDVVKKIKWLIKNQYNIKKLKVGHAGTLDPLATGLLVICTGKFTKKINEIQLAEKEYTGIITLGATTPSFDLEKEMDKEFPTDHINQELVTKIASSFIGKQEQIAPIHSAKKIEGKRTYELARAGKEVIIKSNAIHIKEFDAFISCLPKMDKIENSKIHQAQPYQKGVHIKFRITCSKGTYIRAIARDFGKRIHSGGHLSVLRRTRIGDYSVNQAIEIDSLIV